MALPKQVEQEMKHIEEMERKMQAPVDDGQTAEPEQPEAEEPPAVEAQPTQAVEQPEVSEETWEHKYHRLQGKYDAEVPRLHSQVKELIGRVESLTHALETKEQPKEEQPKRSQLVTDQDREAFGEDLIDLQRRVAQEVASQYEAKFTQQQEQIAYLTQALQQQGNQVGEMTFEQKLRWAVPDFDAINNDPRWVEWLNAYSPELNGSRRVPAQDAYARGDVDAVAHYVNLFKQTIAPKKADKRQAELERQVAPTKNASTGTAPNQQGKTYSMSEWSSLYDKVAQMVSRGKIDEAQKLEAELASAMQTGRVNA